MQTFCALALFSKASRVDGTFISPATVSVVNEEMAQTRKSSMNMQAINETQFMITCSPPHNPTQNLASKYYWSVKSCCHTYTKDSSTHPSNIREANTPAKPDYFMLRCYNTHLVLVIRFQSFGWIELSCLSFGKQYDWEKPEVILLRSFRLLLKTQCPQYQMRNHLISQRCPD